MAKTKKSNTNSQPHCLIEKTFNTDAAKNSMRRYYDATAEALFRLSFSAQIYGGDEAAASISAYVQEEIQKVSTSIKDERKRVKKLLDDNGINAQVTFPAPKTFSAKITSPSAGSLLGLISQLDLLVTDMINLWLHGVLDDQQFRYGTYLYQRQLLKMMGRLRQRWYEVRKEIRERQQDGEGNTPEQHTEEAALAKEPADTSEKPKKAKAAAAPKAAQA